MSEPMTGEEAIRRAERAHALLTDPLIVETFAALEAEYIRLWRRNDPQAPSTPEGRDALWLLLQNLETFRGMFQAYIRTGQVAAAQRDEREAAKRATPER